MHYFPFDKDPGEDVIVTFDFSDVLSTQTLASAVVTCELFKLGGAAKVTGAQEGVLPSAMISGAATVLADGLTVTQKITGGIDGNDYLLTCSGVTSLETPKLAGKLRVRRAT